MRNITRIILISIALITVSNSCKISYSFTGASISPDIKTIFIDYFPNHASLVNPSLSQQTTEALKDKFVSQTSLELTNGAADLEFKGKITDYRTKPMGIQGNETSALNRLTVTIFVEFKNNKNPKDNFEQTFSAYEDYDSNKSLDEVEDQIVAEILEKITEDIFNKSVAKW